MPHMERDPPNPYIDADLDTLAKRAMDLAGALLKDKPAGRRDVAYLLIAASHRLDPQIGVTGSPHQQLRSTDATIRDAYWPSYERLAHLARHRILVQAVEAAGQPPTAINDYLGSGCADGALTSDAGLQEALEDLERRRPRR